jgi:8-oxo-dGTP diphosphatase
MNNKIKSWERVIATLIFVIKGNKVLLGQILGGTIAGFLTPPGGKVEKGETTKLCAIRELREEAGLKALEINEVAKVKIRIIGKSRTVTLHVFVCKSFTGRVRRLEREFSYLKWFNTKTIPYHKMPPGDEGWMKRVISGERLEMNMLCGNDRLDLREFTIRILP